MEQLTQGCNGREYCRQECFELGWRCVQVGVQSGIKARWVGVWAWSRNIVPTAVPPTGPRTGAERGSLEAGTEDGHGGVGRGVCRVRRIMSKGAPPPFPRRRLSSATASPLNSPLPSPSVLSPSPLLVSPPLRALSQVFACAPPLVSHAPATMASKSFWSQQQDPDDPLSQALQPPPDESPEDRAARIRQQEDALRVSKEIDDDIALARRAFERRKKAIKILLLGPFPLSPSPPPLLDIFACAYRPSRVGQEYNPQESVFLSFSPPFAHRRSSSIPDFQLAFSPSHFHKERAAWKTIIQLNLIRYVL